MSDGASDGYRAGLEERERQRKLAAYGVDLCYTCGKQTALHSTDPYSFERYKHVDNLSGEVPSRVKFCSQGCADKNREMVTAVLLLESFVGEESSHTFSPAFRVSARKLIEDVLRKSRRPNV